MKLITLGLLGMTFLACQKPHTNHHINLGNNMEKQNNIQLPTIGILLFDGFLANEVVAPLDVFTKATQNEQPLFKVLLVAEKTSYYVSEEGLKILPDITIANCPDLDVLVVPSSMNPANQTKDRILIEFIQKQNKKTSYIASHCAGAFLLGESGIADGKQIVTYCGGSKALQTDYPNLIVKDDSVNTMVTDGKIISSNGNLVSYTASLELLEKMAGKEQRQQVANELLIHKLNNTNITDYITKSNNIAWEPLIENGVHYDGISVKSLHFDKATNRSKSILLKFEKGASYPFHIHPAGEEVLVLEGSCVIFGETLHQGDYLYTPPTGKHGVTSKTGCVLFLSIPEEVILIPENE